MTKEIIIDINDSYDAMFVEETLRDIAADMGYELTHVVLTPIEGEDER